MGVLLVNVGTVAVPDWREVGCGGTPPATVLLADPFTRADSATSPGGSWLVMAQTNGFEGTDTYTGTAVAGISSNAGYVVSRKVDVTAGQSLYTIVYQDFGTADVDISLTIVDNGSCGIMARVAAGGGSGIFVAPSAGIILDLNGSALASFSPTSAGDVLRLVCNGTACQLFKNGTSVTSFSNSYTSTLHGWGGGANFKVDNFNISTIGGAPGRLTFWDGTQYVREKCDSDSSGTVYVGSATGSSVTNSVSLTAPAGIQAGDFLVVTGAAWSPNMSSTNLTAGYTAGGQNNGTRIWTRTADGTESGTTVTMTNGFGAGAHLLVMQVFRGPSTYNTRGTSATSGGTPTTYDCPTTGTGLGTFLLQETWYATAATAVTITPPSQVHDVVSLTAGPANSHNAIALTIGFETQTVSSGTSTAARTATASVASSWASSTASFPAPAPIAHPLQIEDPANPGTWITVACMVPL